jgi:hypothetical protein
MGTEQSIGRLLAVATVSAILGGCAAGGPGVGFAGVAGGSCEALRKEMNALVARGVIGDLDARQAGRKLSKEAAARVERYNAALNGYLGQECHNQ